ncbi:MAG: hypothetical protein JRF33_15995 [Deltaproteobacteria bacterium]|nr:hypothetical protein [Deltaproteobacteria bacterium]
MKFFRGMVFLWIAGIMVLLGQPRLVLAQNQVLPPEVGNRLGERILEGELEKHLPSGWHLEKMDVRPGKIEIRIREGEQRIGLDLTRLEDGDELRGRWFAIKLEEDIVETEKRVALIEIGKIVDGWFSVSPWKNAGNKLGNHRKDDADGLEALGNDKIMGSKGYFIAMGVLQWLLLVFALFWAFRWPKDA